MKKREAFLLAFDIVGVVAIIAVVVVLAIHPDLFMSYTPVPAASQVRSLAELLKNRLKY